MIIIVETYANTVNIIYQQKKCRQYNQFQLVPTPTINIYEYN